MDLEILAYLGAALMIVLAVLAYRYWHATATYARRMRELHAHQAMGPLMGSAPMATESPDADVTAPEDDNASPQAAEIAGHGEPEEEDDRVLPSNGEHDALAPEPTGETGEVEPEPVGKEPHDESTEDHDSEVDQPVEEAGVAIPTTVSDPASTDTEPSPAPGDEPGLNTAGTTELETEPIPATDTSGSAPATARDAEAGSFEDPEPHPDEPREEPGRPEGDATDEQTGESEGDAGPGSIKPNSGGTLSELKPEYRLIEELEPRKRSSRTVETAGSLAKLLKELDDQLDALPSGIELIDLPILERRRIADRREELLADRELLLEQKKRGAHRRRRRSRTKG